MKDVSCVYEGTPLPPLANVVDGGFFIFRFRFGLCFLRLLILGLYCSYSVLYGNLMKLVFQLIWRVFFKWNPFQSGIYLPFFHLLLERLLRLYRSCV